MTKKDEDAKSIGATFSLKEKKKDQDDLELLDGTKVYFKSLTDFDDVDFLAVQRKIKEAQKYGEEITALFDNTDDLDDKQTTNALKKARLAVDGVLKVIFSQITNDQLKSIGGVQMKMQVITWWTERNIGKKAPGQPV